MQYKSIRFSLSSSIVALFQSWNTDGTWLQGRCGVNIYLLNLCKLFPFPELAAVFFTQWKAEICVVQFYISQAAAGLSF